MGAMASPLTGSDGNVEFLLHARSPAAEHRVDGDGDGDADPAQLAAAAVAEAETAAANGS